MLRKTSALVCSILCFNSISALCSQQLNFQQGANERGEGVYTQYMTEAERVGNTAENSSAKSISQIKQTENVSNVAAFYKIEPQTLTFIPMAKYQQTLDYTCGPSAVMLLLNHYGYLKNDQMNHETEVKIAKEMGTSETSGTNPEQIVSWLKKHDFLVTYGTEGTVALLKENIAKKTPVLVEWIDWGGHWVVANGLYLDSKNPRRNSLIFFADPAYKDHSGDYDGLTSFNLNRFSSMWLDAQYFKPGHIVHGVYIMITPTAKSHVH